LYSTALPRSVKEENEGRLKASRLAAFVDGDTIDIANSE
jgi:hypothetical protein